MKKSILRNNKISVPTSTLTNNKNKKNKTTSIKMKKQYQIKKEIVESIDLTTGNN